MVNKPKSKEELISPIETKIKSKYTRTLRLDSGILKNRKESINIFLEKFFTKWNLEKNTIYADTKEIQTVSGRRRSLGDIYSICKYYYPNITLEEIIKILINNINTKSGWRTSYCSQTNMRMYYYTSLKENGYIDKGTKDEFGLTYEQYTQIIK
jgi:hypothetical protein